MLRSTISHLSTFRSNHDATKQRATICFLILPCVLDSAEKIKYFNQALDFTDASGIDDAAKHNSSVEANDISKRFGHLLATLHLRPFVHGSQRRVFASGSNATKTAKGKKKGEASVVPSGMTHLEL